MPGAPMEQRLSLITLGFRTFLWEVAWNPRFPIRDDGATEIGE